MVNQQLSDYISQARKSGMGDDGIREGLLQSGWQPADVEEAFKSAGISNIESLISNL